MKSAVTLIGLFVGTSCGLLLTNQARADLIPPGHKGVEHLLVFEESPALEQHRLVAAPTRGLQGAAEVRAGQPFAFSSKYGTRLYLIPKEVTPLPEFDRDVYSQWPSAEPPIGEIASVPIISPITSVRTTLRLADVTSGEPQIELVTHQELDDSRQVVSWSSYLWRPLVIVPVGVVVLFTAVFVLRKTRAAKT